MKRHKKRRYVVMWSYQDEVGVDGGHLEIWAKTRTHAERIFAENNRQLITGVDKHGELRFNPKGGFTNEGTLTYDEWVELGKPERV